MDLLDINVQVLYDFEYGTKDGKQVSIKQGEKLFLIKKTNEDWWQVIRKSGRPFYVPASYVQEINKGEKFDITNRYVNNIRTNDYLELGRRTVDRIKVRDEPYGEVYRSRSCSFESQKTYGTAKPVPPKKNIHDKPSDLFGNTSTALKDKLRSNELNVQHQNYPEEDEEEADYVNLPKVVDRASPSVHLEMRPEHQNYSDNSMSTSLSSTDSDRIAENKTAIVRTNIADNGYSRVNIKSVKTSALNDENNARLNLSNSLEELSNEICKKSSPIKSNADVIISSSCSDYRKVRDIVKYITKDTDVSLKNINNGGSLKHVNHSSSVASSQRNTNENEKSKLHYAGSFKTKHEREKWAKNYVLLTAMKEEEQQENGDNFSKNYQNVSSTTDDDNKIPTNDTDVNTQSNVRICDRINNYEVKLIESCAVKSSADSRTRPIVQKIINSNLNNGNSNNLDSSSEELAYSPASSNVMKSSISDKGSTDSLLDVDNAFGNPDGSLCTTASDSLLHTSDTSDEEFKQIQHKSSRSLNVDDSKKKKCVLTRNGRIESCRLRFPVRGVSPPVPELNQKPNRELFGGWSEYKFSDGRTFFYNCETGEKSWKPPRRRSSNEARKHDNGSFNNLYSGSSSPLAEIDEFTTADTTTAAIHSHQQQFHQQDVFHDVARNSPRNVSTTINVTNTSKGDELSSNRRTAEVSSLQQSLSVNLPAGWKSYVDTENGFQCYVHLLTGAKWFSSHDDDGRVYYFEENSSESSWTLPSVTTFSSTEKLDDDIRIQEDDSSTVSHVYSNVPLNHVSRPNFNVPITSSVGSGISVATSDSSIVSNDRIQNRTDKTKSLIIAEPPKNEVQSTFISKNWPQLWDGHMYVLKEGPLNRTKITENGKRLRKNWSSSHVVLTELFLLFFKDAKAFAALKTGGGRPEMCVDLNGALIDRGDKVSSRKNVYIISTVLGLQVLIQNDCTQQADLWLLAIQAAIKNLPSGFDSCPRLTRGVIDVDGNPSPESESSKKFYKITRSKSVKTKNKDGSIEDLTVSPAERQTKIKARLKKFFHRRPPMEALVKKGIWKDEPVFGSYLEKVCTAESPRVPVFVQQCINCIEKSEENMKTDGLYRASGNLSQVQKIRLQVDQNNLSVMDEEEDVHVLTGALKLFFRELKEPLIPYHFFNKAIKASNNHNKKEKIATFREITKSLPPANHDTLKLLLQHLLRVTNYKEFNRMHIPNLAIVFGPTLMWPEQESMNMALDLMQQNLVIECFLLEFDHIFK